MIGEISPPRSREMLDCCQFMQQLESGNVFGGTAPQMTDWEEEEFLINVVRIEDTPSPYYRGESSKILSHISPRGRRRPECRLDSTKSLFHIVQS